jgi:hypothetical protein
MVIRNPITCFDPNPRSLSDAALPVIASFGASIEYLDLCGS